MDIQKIVDALTGNVEWFKPGRGLTKDEFQKMARETHPAVMKNWDCDEFTIPTEELAELEQAVTKFKRYGRTPEVMLNLHEEVADVLICLSYIIQSCDLSEDIIKEIIRFKTENCIKRDGGLFHPYPKNERSDVWDKMRDEIMESIKK